MFFDRLARTALIALVVGLPWFFGGVEPRYHVVIAGVAFVGLGCALVGIRRTSAAWRAVRLPLVVLAAAVVLGLLQCSPQFGEWVGTWSPESVAVRREFAADPETEPPAAEPLSLHPPSTRRQTAVLLSAVVLFALGATLFADTRSLLLLLGALGLTGAAVSFLGIVQRLSWNGRIYWWYQPRGGQPFGPFINRNNAGGFLELTLAAAIGMLLWLALTVPRFDSLVELRDPRRGRPARVPGFSRRMAWQLAHLNASLLSAAAAVLLISAGIVTSFSRGTFVAATAGAGVALVIVTFTSRRTAFAWVIGLLMAAGLGLVAWLGQSETMYDRLATLLQTEHLGEETRVTHWETSLRSAHDFPWFGSGLGAYRFAYTRHQDKLINATYYYAENQYLDALLSGGTIGLSLFLAMLLVLAVSAMRLLRHARTSSDYGIAAAALLTLTIQATHACFDFAMYVSAVFTPLALMCGAFARRAAAIRHGSLTEEADRRPTGTILTLTLATACLFAVGLIWDLDVSRRASVCFSAINSTRVETPRPALSWVERAIADEQRAVDLCPDDGEARTRLAELWVERYRAAFRDELARLGLDARLRTRESPIALHADAQLLAGLQDDEGLRELRDNPLIAANLKPALAEARAARQLCPLSPYPHLLVAKLCFLDESPQNDLFYLDRAESLAGGRADWLFEIGVLHINASRTNRAFAAFRESWSLSKDHEAEIIRICSGYLPPERLLKEVVPQSPQTIVRIAQKYFALPDQTEDRKIFLRRAAELLTQLSRPSAEQCHLLGSVYAELDEPEEAAKWLQRAVSLDGTRADWYFETAQAFAAIDDWDQAFIHARQSVRLDPKKEEYGKLMNEASEHRDQLGPQKGPENL